MPVSLASTSASSMHGALVPIAYTNGTSSAPVISLTNFPQNYQDLLITGYLLPSNSSTVLTVGINASASGFSSTWLLGNGSSASSSRTTSATSYQPSGLGYPISSTNPTTFELHILNYANTSTYKTMIMRMSSDQNGSGFTYESVGLWQSTAAVAGLSFSTANGGYYWTANTSISAYGIRTVGQ